MESTSKTVGKKFTLRDLVIFLLIGFLTYRFLISPNTATVNVVEASAQVKSVDSKYYGMGTASKSWDESKSSFNVTAFLDKTKAGQFYYVYLKGNGSDLADINMGKMELSGDVYTLNYTMPKNLFGYKDLYITLQSESDVNSGKIGDPIMSGSFSK